tara:strand:- start:220 stop:567 length:348 start_codon:yes stop_codon:yes gene_type:complete
MIKLANILSEVLSTYQVEADIISDKKVNISSILDQIRGLHKVTIVTNTTRRKTTSSKKTENTTVKIKFVSRENPEEDLIQLKKDMTTSDFTPDHKHLRIPGLRSVIFKPKTLKRI